MRPFAVVALLISVLIAPAAVAQDAVEDAYRRAMEATPTPTTLRLEQEEWRAQWTEYTDERVDLEQSRLAELELAIRRHGAIRAARPSLSDLPVSCIDTGFDGCTVERTGTLVLPDGTVLHFQAQSGATEDTGVSEAIVVLQSEGERLRPVLWLFGPLGVLDPEVYVSFDEAGTPAANGGYIALPAYGQGTGRHWLGTLFRWNGASERPTEIDAQSWLDDLAGALPPGLAVWKGPGFQWEYLTAYSPLWQDDDGNCCPTGGDVGIDLKVEGDRLVLGNISVNDAVLTVARSIDPAVLEWAARQQQCQYWLSEDGYDADRDAEIRGNLSRLRCATLEADEANLRAAFADRASVIAVMDRAKAEAP